MRGDCLYDPKSLAVLVLGGATLVPEVMVVQNVDSVLDITIRCRVESVIVKLLPALIGVGEIIMLRNGLIAERGTHRDLLMQDGLYASIWSRQRKADEAEERLRQVCENDDMGVVSRGVPAAE